MKSGNYKLPLITTIIFLVIGIVLLVVGFFNEIVSWLWKYGLVLLAVTIPIIITIVHKIVSKKIDNM